MSDLCQVFETGAAKWVMVEEGQVVYVSDKTRATVFYPLDLAQANQWFGDFSIYKRTLRAVPIGTNYSPQECQTVREYLDSYLPEDF